ncbi:hypothetical protein ACQ4PT_063394 [Festuca glaucescens]
MESAVSTTDRQHVDCYRRKNTLMLATLMASATYAVGFNPPGGVWQDMAGHLPGDPIMRSTHYHRYLVFFYFNAAAFTLSLMVVVLTLILNVRPPQEKRAQVRPAAAASHGDGRVGLHRGLWYRGLLGQIQGRCLLRISGHSRAQHHVAVFVVRAMG